MAEPVKIQVRQVVVCDDIRREDNGKEMLIGVYSGGIVVGSFPVQMGLCFWVQFHTPAASEEMVPLEIRLLGDGDVQFVHLGAGLTLGKPGLGSVSIGPMPVFLQIPTTLRLQLKQHGDEWQTINETMVEKGPVSTGRVIGVANAPGFPQSAVRETA